MNYVVLGVTANSITDDENSPPLELLEDELDIYVQPGTSREMEKNHDNGANAGLESGHPDYGKDKASGEGRPNEQRPRFHLKKKRRPKITVCRTGESEKKNGFVLREFNSGRNFQSL